MNLNVKNRISRPVDPFAEVLDDIISSDNVFFCDSSAESLKEVLRDSMLVGSEKI